MSSKLTAIRKLMMSWLLALRGQVQALAQSATAEVRYRLGLLDSLFEVQSAKLAQDNKAAGESINQLVIVGATLVIGLIVISQIVASMPEMENSTFTSTLDRVEQVLDSSFLLAAILPIVIIAGALLFYVRNFNDNGGR